MANSAFSQPPTQSPTPVTSGGTGATTAADARANLGVAQCSFRACRDGSNQNLSNAMYNEIVFDKDSTGQFWDSDNAYNTTDGKFTVPAGKGGVYSFTTFCYLYSTITVGNAYTAHIYVDGVSVAACDYISTTTAELEVHISSILTLAAGAVVQIRIYAGSNCVVYSGNTYSYFCGHRVSS